MGLIRLLMFGLLVWLIWQMFENYKAKLHMSQRQGSRVAHDKMVQCSYCSVYLPKKDAVSYNDCWFCDQQHKARYLAGHAE